VTGAASPLPAAIGGWLGSVLAGQPILHWQRLAGGYSNDNLLVTTGAGDQLVLRRYLRANRCSVEAALAARLRGVVPVPEVIAADPDGSRAGEPVLLARFVSGLPLGHALADAGQQDQAGLGRRTGAALAAIGTVAFGCPGEFTGPDLVPDASGWPASLPAFVERCLADGQAGHALLSAAERDGLRELARTSAPLADHVAGASQLVHADFNPKNLLVSAGPDGWAVAAVLDWEFAFSGSPLIDVGNMLRFGGQVPAAFQASFIAGFQDAGGELPERWREISEALDLYALAEFLTRPPEHEFAVKAVGQLRQRMQRAGVAPLP
jgi:aminoglycoside phosphotransferase (APT) family kinase protein